jgi:hypothetical protein
MQALLAAYDGWKEAERRGQGRDFCWRNFLSSSTLRMVSVGVRQRMMKMDGAFNICTHETKQVDDMRRQFQQLLRDAGLLEPPPGSGHVAPGGMCVCGGVCWSVFVVRLLLAQSYSLVEWVYLIVSP